MPTSLNAPIEMQFRISDGLSIRIAESEDRDHHALLLSPYGHRVTVVRRRWLRRPRAGIVCA